MKCKYASIVGVYYKFIIRFFPFYRHSLKHNETSRQYQYATAEKTYI